MQPGKHTINPLAAPRAVGWVDPLARSLNTTTSGTRRVDGPEIKWGLSGVETILRMTDLGLLPHAFVF